MFSPYTELQNPGGEEGLGGGRNDIGRATGCLSFWQNGESLWTQGLFLSTCGPMGLRRHEG